MYLDLYAKRKVRYSELSQSLYCLRTQFSVKIKIICSDNGLEFHLPDLYAVKGIIHQRTCVETPEQNGIVERKHQHLLRVARSLRFQSGFPLKY